MISPLTVTATVRHLHAVGVEHSHNVFDDSSSNGTSSKTAMEFGDEAVLEELDLENRKRAITMSVLFCTLMIVYIGFCFYYQKVHKVRRRIGDSVHRRSLTRDGREQRRRSNRAVLDESSDAAHRARRDQEMARMLDERRDKIRAVLITKLLVDEDPQGNGHGAAVHADEGDKASSSHRQGFEQSSADELEYARTADIDISNTITLSTSQETRESHGDVDLQGHQATTTTATSSSSSCVDFKKYADALQSSISSGTKFVCSPQNANYCGGGGGATCSNSNHNGCSNSNHNSHQNSGSNHQPNVKSAHPNGNGNTTTMLSILQNQECNICLSNFQVGDRIAWSCKNQTQFIDFHDSAGTATATNNGDNSESICRHIFHAECIERWLLVREGCPVCRRSYFDEHQENDAGPLAVRNRVVTNRVVVEDTEEDVDLEMGDTNNIHQEGLASTSAVTASAPIVAVEV
ncbi:hypothetical protein ACHAW6_014572 [Cyclotella cf. meneghiniana]